MPTRASQTAQDLLDDAKRVLGAGKKHLKRFQAADKAKTIKTVTASGLAAFAADITAAGRAKGAVKAGKAAVGSATQAEQAARTKLFGLLAAIRDDVKLGYPSDAPLQEAFGVGQRLTDRATKKLLDAADAVAAAYEDDETDYAARAKAVGVTPARVASLAKARAALDDANQTQGAKLGARKGSASDKQTLLAKVTRETARIRAAAKVALKSDAKALADFASVVARRAVKKRPVPPAPPPVPAV
ncbi:MAG TPA: hypothetical protein VGM56_23905 [Byssovorax sp.]|jgi:hypothetical protein